MAPRLVPPHLGGNVLAHQVATQLTRESAQQADDRVDAPRPHLVGVLVEESAEVAATVEDRLPDLASLPEPLVRGVRTEDEQQRERAACKGAIRRRKTSHYIMRM